MKIAILYGSTLGNTERVAELIKSNLKEFDVSLFNIKDVEEEDFEKINACDFFIFGSSTWGVGDLQDDWESFDFKKLNLVDKKVAIFGLGDSEVYACTYCDAMSKLNRILKSKKAVVVGKVSAKNYKYTKSESVEDNYFVGLALDEDNYETLTEERVLNWVENLKTFFK